MTMMGTKICSKCAQPKDVDQFGRNATQADGRSFYCLECNRRSSNEHYRRRRAAQGKPVREPDTSPEGFKRCTDCREVKPVSAFHKHPTQSDGLAIYCKPCRKVRGRKLHLKQTYGLDDAALSAMVAEQGGVCAICRRRPAVHVDHDHVFGGVRGVLCFACNVALGQLQDDPRLFRNAIDYLERNQKSPWQRTDHFQGVYRLPTQRRGAAASATSSELQRLISSRRG